jgi:Family of unknown function (DUF5681)
MTLSSTTAYAVGRGEPPLHTRFQKGHSGNPSGKPGPAKLAKRRFQRALYAALDTAPEDLEHSKPENALDALAKRMVLDGVAGRMPAVRTVLSLLDAEYESGADDGFEDLSNEAELFSLVQGKTQGNEKSSTAQSGDAGPAGDDYPGKGVIEPAPVAAGPKRPEEEPVSLLQGKKQGNGKNPETKTADVVATAEVMRDAPAQTDRRTQLMMSRAAVSQGNNMRLGVPPPGWR